jgi:hypothetical protein
MKVNKKFWEELEAPTSLKIGLYPGLFLKKQVPELFTTHNPFFPFNQSQ